MVLTVTELIHIKHLKHCLADINALWMLVLTVPKGKV